MLAVFIISLVGMPAWALEILGKYPPLALMVIYCTPFFISTFCTDGELFADLPKKIIPRLKSNAKVRIIEAVLFIK